MGISVVLPAYNEAARIRDTVSTIAAFLEQRFPEWEIIVVDDGSGDGTEAAVQDLRGVRCLRNDVNRGKGYSVRRGMLEARFDPILFSDVDLSTPIEEALALLEAIEAGADIAIGTRRPGTGKSLRRTPLRRLMAWGFRTLVKALVIRGYHDTQCGFKMLRRVAARRIFPLQRRERWGFDVELLLIARQHGLRVAQVPVSYHESSESRLRLHTPLTMLADLLKIRWSSLLGRYGPRG
ncbi:MAG: glycosyltransferase family 2 protein [Planctomycetes bacterium]|nr:glycosyltransferase family 2 protein [Planctomycetota bacterium]